MTAPPLQFFLKISKHAVANDYHQAPLGHISKNAYAILASLFNEGCRMPPNGYKHVESNKNIPPKRGGILSQLQAWL